MRYMISINQRRKERDIVDKWEGGAGMTTDQAWGVWEKE